MGMGSTMGIRSTVTMRFMITKESTMGIESSTIGIGSRRRKWRGT